MSNIEDLVKDILLNEISDDLAKRIAKALEINEHLTSTYELSVNVEDILSTDRNADPSNSGFYVKLEGTRSGVSFFYDNNLTIRRKPDSRKTRVVQRWNNIKGFSESFWHKWADKWLNNQESLVEKIVKKSDGYYVTSEDGKKNLGGPYDTEDKAKKRLQQVHYFKNKGKKVNEEDTPKQKVVNRRSKRDIAKLARDKGFDGLIDARDLSIHHIDSDSRDINGLKDNSYKNLWFIKGGKDWKDRELVHKIIHFMDRNNVSYDNLLNNLEDFKLYQYDEETGNFKERTLSMFREAVKVNESKVIDISKLKPFKTIKAGNGTFWKFYKKDGKIYDDRGLEVSAEEIKNLKLDETIEKFVKIDDDELLKMADTLYDNGIITKNQLLFGSLTDKDIRKLYRKWFKENGKMRHKPKEESLNEATDTRELKEKIFDLVKKYFDTSLFTTAYLVKNDYTPTYSFSVGSSYRDRSATCSMDYFDADKFSTFKKELTSLLKSCGMNPRSIKVGTIKQKHKYDWGRDTKEDVLRVLSSITFNPMVDQETLEPKLVEGIDPLYNERELLKSFDWYNRLKRTNHDTTDAAQEIRGICRLLRLSKPEYHSIATNAELIDYIQNNVVQERHGSTRYCDDEIEESLIEGAEGKREPGYEYIIYDYTDENGPNPIVAKRSTRTEAEYTAMRWMGNDYITNSRPHPKYKDRYLTFEKVPKGKFKVGDDFYGPFDQDYNKLESLTEALDVDSLISQNLRPMQLFAKAFALDPHIRPDERGGQEALDKLFAYADNYFKEHPVQLSDVAHLEMLDEYDIDDDEIELGDSETYLPHEFNVANAILEDDYTDDIIVQETNIPGVIYITSNFEDGFTTMENLKKYFSDENTFNYNLQEYVKDYLGESLTEDKRYFPWDFGEDDSFFTREELDEFTAELQDIAPSDVAVYKAFIDSNNVLEVDWSYQDFEETSSMKIDMRKIKTPSDLIKRYLPSFKFLIDSRVNAIEMGIDESLDKKSINESSLVKDNIELDDGILEWGWEKPNSYYVEKNYWVDKDNSLARVDFKRYYSSPEAARRAFNRYKKQFGE